MEKTVAQVSTRKEALALGAQLYATGVPCKYGHNEPRYAKSGMCLGCIRVRTIEKGPQLAAYQQKWYQKNREWVLERMANQCPEKRAENGRRYRERFPEKVKAMCKRFREQNPHHSAMLASRRRGRIYAAIPKLRDDLTPIYQAEMLAIYAESRTISELTGVPHHVDHIFPISKGGVHAPWNLRVILGSDNVKKNAKIPKDEPTYVMWQGEMMSRLIETTE